MFWKPSFVRSFVVRAMRRDDERSDRLTDRDVRFCCVVVGGVPLAVAVDGMSHELMAAADQYAMTDPMDGWLPKHRF